MQDCHSCDPGSIPGAGATISEVNCDSSANPAPHFDPIDSRCRPCYVDAGPTSGALDYVAHG